MKKELFQYTSCFCEENIYLLCQKIIACDSLYAVFISNPSKSVAFWQHNGMRPEKQRENRPVVWDYHVIAVSQSQYEIEIESDNNDDDNNSSSSSKGWVVFDFDSSVEPFPTPLLQYLDETFSPNKNSSSTILRTNPLFQPMFRIIPARLFLDHFASDRSHMDPHSTRIKFPPYTPIRGPLAAVAHNLPLYWDMTTEKVGGDPVFGTVVGGVEAFQSTLFKIKGRS